MSDSPKPAPQIINASGYAIGSSEAFGTLTAWKSVRMAERWFHDALAAAEKTGADARRHEIIFAVCFAESWLFEWARDIVLRDIPTRLEDLDAIFPKEDRRRGILERWGAVIDRLSTRQLVTKRPNYSTTHREDWERLVVFRNGLVHGDTSRPYVEGEALARQPTFDDLLRLAPRWAVRTAFDHTNKLREIVPKRLIVHWPTWLSFPANDCGS